MEAIKRRIRLQQKKHIQNERNTCAKSLKAFRMIVRARVFRFFHTNTHISLYAIFSSDSCLDGTHTR